MGRWERVEDLELGWRELCSSWVVDLGLEEGNGLNSY